MSPSEAERKQQETDRRKEEAAQREQQERQHREQRESGIRPSPPPYESAEWPLERLGPGFAYLFGVVGGALLLNLLILVVIAGSNGG